MDTFNEQQLSMCETNELVDYIAELRVKNDEAVENHFSDLKLRETTWKEWNTLVEENEKLKERKDEAMRLMKASDKENDELKEQLVEKQKELITKCKIDLLKTQEIDKLKDPVIKDRDARCCQFDIRVGYSYIMDCLEGILTEEEYNHFCESDYQEKADFVCEEVARTIDSAINSHIINPVGQLEYHIVDKVSDKVAVLRDSGHIYEEYPVDDE